MLRIVSLKYGTSHRLKIKPLAIKVVGKNLRSKSKVMCDGLMTANRKSLLSMVTFKKVGDSILRVFPW